MDKEEKNRNIRIAFLGNQIYYGGGAKSLYLLIKSVKPHVGEIFLYVTHIASQQMKKEFEELVVFVKLIELPELVGAQTETVDSNYENYEIDKVKNALIKDWISELNTLNIDILHINNSVFAPIYDELKATGCFKIVTHIREWIHWNGIHQKQKYIISQIYNNSDSIIAISDTEAEPFLGHSNLHILTNPFDFSEIDAKNFDRKKTLQKLGIPDDKFIVGMMGSFQKSKGVLDFFESLSILNRIKGNQDKFLYLYLGQKSPELYHKLKFILYKFLKRSSFLMEAYEYLKSEKLLKNVVLLSNRKDIFEIINCFDVAVRPSHSGDPWGRDVIEFMAMKKAIVVTGKSEFFIKEGKTGFHISSGAPNELAEKIEVLSNNEAKRVEFGNNSFKLIKEKAGFYTYHEKVLYVYSKIFV